MVPLVGGLADASEADGDADQEGDAVGEVEGVGEGEDVTEGEGVALIVLLLDIVLLSDTDGDMLAVNVGLALVRNGVGEADGMPGG